MISEPLLLTLFYAIAATAVIGALNARGLTRLAISSALALFCLGAAVFHTVHYMAYKETMMDALTNPAGLAEIPPTFPVSHDTGAMAAASTDTVAQATPGSELSGIADDATRLQKDLGAIDLSRVGNMSEAEYARLRNLSSTCATEARTLRDRVSGIAATGGEAVELLKGAIEQLDSATRNLNRFFNAESGSEEKALAAAFRSNVQSAGAALEKTRALLSGTPQVVAP